MNTKIDAAHPPASQAEQKEGLPERWRLVPEEPTSEMQFAGLQKVRTPDELARRLAAVYRAMIAAAPTPTPSSEGHSAGEGGKNPKNIEEAFALRMRNEWRGPCGHIWRKDWSEACPYCATLRPDLLREVLGALEAACKAMTAVSKSIRRFPGSLHEPAASRVDRANDRARSVHAKLKAALAQGGDDV